MSISDAPVVWAVVCPRGLVMGGVFACHEDALVASESRNALLRDTYPEIKGNYSSVQALAFFPDSLGGGLRYD